MSVATMIELLDPLAAALAAVIAAGAAWLLPRGAPRRARALSLGLLAVAVGGPVFERADDTTLHRIIFIDAAQLSTAQRETASTRAWAEVEAAWAEAEAAGTPIGIVVDSAPHIVEGALERGPWPGPARWSEAFALAAGLIPAAGPAQLELWAPAGAPPDPASLPAALRDLPRVHRVFGAVTAPAIPVQLDGDRTATPGGTLRLRVDAPSATGSYSLALRDGAGTVWPLDPLENDPADPLTRAIPPTAAPGAAALELRAADGRSEERALLLRAPPTAWVLAADPGEQAALAKRLQEEGAVVDRPSDAALVALGPRRGPSLLVLGGVAARRLSTGRRSPSPAGCAAAATSS